MFIDEQNAALYDVQESITNMHNDGYYPVALLLSKDEEEQKNEEGILIKGYSIEGVEDEMTEIVTVRIPLYTVSVSFFNAILKPKFTKSDGHRVTVYSGKDVLHSFIKDNE